MFSSLKRLFSRRPASVDDILTFPGGKRFYREQHELRRENMDPDALKVVNRLNRGGYRSYLVGGCVRDMLLGRRPKDFDVVTSATPAQIRTLFSNSRTIGRRFKIVHVVFRGKIIEVSTFRSLPQHRLRGGSGGKDVMLHRDNEFGTPREDAARRDFTMNALFFDPRNESIIDYVGGFEDVLNKTIRIIGDPDISFREDPVRMFRAAKFGALLDFQMDPECARAVRKHASEISKASPSRMLEEYGKVFRTGQTYKIFKNFADSGLFKALMPETWGAMKGAERKLPFEETQVGKRLAFADKILHEREDLTANIYFALLFAELVRKVIDDQINKNVVEYIKSRLNAACKRLQLPGKDRDRLVQIFASQQRFKDTGARKRFKPEFFRQKVYFYETFMVYKIIAISRQDEEGMQKAMFWEIGPRTKPPERGKTITMFEKHRNRPPRGNDRERGPRDRAERESGGRRDRPDRSRSERGEPGRARGGANRQESGVDEDGADPSLRADATTQGEAPRPERKGRRRRGGRNRSARKESQSPQTGPVDGA